MPETICAATRDGSPLPDVMAYDNIVNAAAPTATNMLVRNPALRCRIWRSTPIMVPNTKAQPSLTKYVVNKIITICFWPQRYGGAAK